jgi:membrane fusion protein, multidrug efflux system
MNPASTRAARRALPLAVLSMLAASLLLPACSNRRSDRAELPAASVQPIPVRVVKPTTSAQSGESRVSSTLRSKSEATLSAKTTGQILKLDARVGDRVKAGQVLVRIDASMASIMRENAKAQERLAQANLANAKAELDRATQLHDQGALPDATFDKLRMAFDIASAQTDQSHASIRATSQQITDATISAPFSGVVSARFKSRGDTVSGTPPTALLSLVDPDHLEVRIAVPEALVPLLKLGDPLPATASPSGAPFQVRISALGATVDAISRTVEVLADVVEPIDPSLKPGALATVDVSSAKGLQGLFLPVAAWKSGDGQSFVNVVVADRLKRKPVVAALIRPGTVLVTEGLSADDAVALDVSGLPEGQPVRAIAN